MSGLTTPAGIQALFAGRQFTAQLSPYPGYANQRVQLSLEFYKTTDGQLQFLPASKEDILATLGEEPMTHITDFRYKAPMAYLELALILL